MCSSYRNKTPLHTHHTVIWRIVTRRFVPDMPVCFTFNFKGQKSKKKNILAYGYRRWNRCIISKLRKPIITWCGVVVLQKNWKFSYGEYLGHKCGCFSVVAFGQKCLIACTLQQPRVIQPSEVNFRVCKSVHHYTFNWINQPAGLTTTNRTAITKLRR
jgi:hypothetical protein